MIAAIADILKDTLTGLDWIERFAGLVVEAKKPTTVTGGDGQTLVTGWQSWPIACDVNAEKCFENQQKLKWFVPDSSVSAVAYFVDNGGCVSLGFDDNTPNRGGLVYRFNLKFVCWMNMKRLGDAITSGECYAADKVVPYVIAAFHNPSTSAQVFGADTVKALAYRRVEITNVTQLPKTPQLFAPFSFWNLPDKQAMFIWPYDYFALSIQGTFIVNRFCLADLYEPPFVADETICLPGEPTDDYRITEAQENRILETEEGRILE